MARARVQLRNAEPDDPPLRNGRLVAEAIRSIHKMRRLAASSPFVASPPLP